MTNPTSELDRLRFITKMQHEIINAQRALLRSKDFPIESREWNLRYYLEHALKWLDNQVIHNFGIFSDKKDSA